jgi:ribonuclease HI
MSKHHHKTTSIAIPSHQFQYTLKTDGACHGNPGPMGIGGILQDQSGQTIEMFSENLGYGTNNEAEYGAVLRGIQMAQPYHPQSLLVCADSQLVIYQLIGVYAIRESRLRSLAQQVQRQIATLQCPVEFLWIRREQNSEADALASQAVGMPMAKIDAQQHTVQVWQPDPRFVADNEAIDILPKLHAPCERTIRHLNAHPHGAKFRDFVALKTHGIDAYSRATHDELSHAIRIRFGETAWIYLQDALDGLSSEYAFKVFRWVARGLMPDLALKKVSVDAEVSANAMRYKA